jgi:NADH-quinone oxidoreductase subunit G
VDICPVGALTSKDFRFQMRVWFLKETKSVCPSCATGCNIVIGSREDKIYRYEPRENDAVNACWMCDYGRLNYKWIGREDRLLKVLSPESKVQSRESVSSGPYSGLLAKHAGGASPSPWGEGRGEGERSAVIPKGSGLPNVSSVSNGEVGSVGASPARWKSVLQEISEKLKQAQAGSVAIIASARQTNEELYLLSKLAKKLGALTDSVPRRGEGDRLLLSADRNPNGEGARLTGIAAEPMGSNLPKIAEGIRNGKIKTLVVFGEDVTRHGIGADLLGKLEALIVSDLLPSETTKLAHYLLPGCAHAEKRGTYTNTKGRVQKFMKAIEPRGEARPEWEFLGELVSSVTGEKVPAGLEGLFNQMAASVPAFQEITWAKLGNLGVTANLQP